MQQLVAIFCPLVYVTAGNECLTMNEVGAFFPFFRRLEINERRYNDLEYVVLKETYQKFPVSFGFSSKTCLNFPRRASMPDSLRSSSRRNA